MSSFTEPSSPAKDTEATRSEINRWGNLQPYQYDWPRPDTIGEPPWSAGGPQGLRVRALPESPEELRADSRWPAFFPSPMCVVTTAADGETCLEKVVGASIVNRFPYICALSFCREDLSDRHYPRNRFVELAERGGEVAVQFLPPGPVLDHAMQVILELPDSRAHERIAASGLPVRAAATSRAPVFEAAYLVYEASLARPKTDFAKSPIYEQSYLDVGSHRIYFFEINTIQLDREIAEGRRQIRWFSMPRWRPDQADATAPTGTGTANEAAQEVLAGLKYQKGFRADYRFPAKDTVAFEWDEIAGSMAVKHLPPLPEDQVEVDNDRARWPCFFPSSAGMITTWCEDGRPTCMPCGSTTVVSRQPMVIAPCVSYSRINERYAPRASLQNLDRQGRFGCGVPFAGPRMLQALSYLGNVSFAADPEKITHAGLSVIQAGNTPVLAELPIHFDCKVIDRVRLGTHVMYLGEVERVFMRPDVTAANPLTWCPWPDVGDATE
jgi:flavin reductase (DIM6/NTAB) family NADH-FMN oxidoreductase RutF